MDASSDEGSAGEFCCARSIISKAITLLLTEFVCQCRNVLPLAFTALTSLRSINTEEAAGNIFLH